MESEITAETIHQNEQLERAGYKWFEECQQWLNPIELAKQGLAVCGGGEVRVVNLAAWNAYRLAQEGRMDKVVTRKANDAAKDASLFEAADREALAPVKQRLIA